MRAIELLKGQNFLGLGAIPRLASRSPEIGLPLALFLATVGLGGAIDSIGESLRSMATPMQAALARAQDYLGQHPEHRSAIRRVGVLGVVEAGVG